MQSADRFGPLKGLCPYKALIGLTQATGLAGGFDSKRQRKRIAAPVCGLARNDRARCKIPSILPAHPAGIVRKNTYFGNYGESLSKIAGPQTADFSENVVLRRTVVQINKNSG